MKKYTDVDIVAELQKLVDSHVDSYKEDFDIDKRIIRRAAESQKLLNWGYTAFEAVRLSAPGQPVATPTVWKGRASEVKLGRPEGVVVTVPAGMAKGLRTEVVRPDPLVAPLQKGQPLGTLRVLSAGGEPVAEVPLVVLETVDEAGLLGRLWGALRLWIR